MYYANSENCGSKSVVVRYIINIVVMFHKMTIASYP